MSNPTDLIDHLIAKTPDWRGATFAKLRKIIHDADPEITEELKWRRPVIAMPVWSTTELSASACRKKGLG
jgi:hypothetical protein